MDVLPPSVVYIGIAVVAILIVLLLMRWLAGKFGAGRPGYLYCFLALVVPYVVVAVVLSAAAVGLGFLGLGSDPLLLGGVLVAALLIALLVFAKILDTTVVRGFGIAVCTLITTWVVGALLGAAVVILGVGGAGLERITALADLTGDPKELVSQVVSEVRGAAVAISTPEKAADPVRELRKAVTGLCDCIQQGGACKRHRKKAFGLIEQLDPDSIPAEKADRISALKTLGTQCLAGVPGEESGESSGESSGEDTKAPAPALVAQPAKKPDPSANTAAAESTASDGEQKTPAPGDQGASAVSGLASGETGATEAANSQPAKSESASDEMASRDSMASSSVPAKPASSEAVNEGSASSTVATAPTSSDSVQRTYGYREVDIGSLDQHLRKVVRITMTNGDQRADVLDGVTDTVVVLRQSKSQGGGTYEIARDGIEAIRVLGRW